MPYPLLDKVKNELDRLIREEVITPVQEPTDWCAPMVVVPKPNGQVRICVDYVQLNKVVKREIFPMANVEDSLAKLGAGKIFTKLDANSGFHQIPLSKSAKLLTTFLTPFGRFAYNRLPFGLSSSPEIYSKIMTQVVAGLEGVIVHMDDVCIWGSTVEEHDRRVRAVLQKMTDAQMTLNKSKCEFSRHSIKFLGHVISGKGIEPSPEAVQGIRDFKTPQNVSDVRSFLGMANQFSKFTPLLADLSKPLRDLLCKGTVWYWGPMQEASLANIKEELSRSVKLAAYDPSAETIIQTDASRSGIGAALIQIQSDGTRKVVAAASRSLSDTERRYAMIEQEALGVVWACEKFKNYITGLTVRIQTDHKPLISLLNDIELNKLTVRVQRFRMRLMRFSYMIEHIPGKENVLADALSRSQAAANLSELSFVDEVEFCVTQSQSVHASQGKLHELSKLQKADEILALVRSFVLGSWPAYLTSNDVCLQPYFDNRSLISIQNDLLTMGDRIIIPQTKRVEILQTLHEGHLGITKCRDRARQIVWWPGISQQIAEMVRNCNTCRRHANKVHEPLMPAKFPKNPWQKVGSDLFYHGNQWYLLIVDYYSRFVEIAQLHDLSSKQVVIQLKSIFLVTVSLNY